MSRPCSVCIDYDRPAIDQAILEGRPLSEISRQTPYSRETLARHVRHGHLSKDIAKKVERSQRITMDGILEKVQKSVERAEQRVIEGRKYVDPITGKELEAQGIADQYYAPTERVIIEGMRLQSSIMVEATKLQLEQDKLKQSNGNGYQARLARAADWVRTHYPDDMQAFSAYVDKE